MKYFTAQELNSVTDTSQGISEVFSRHIRLHHRHIRDLEREVATSELRVSMLCRKLLSLDI